MINFFKLQIILCISLSILIPSNLIAQKDFTPKQALKNQPVNYFRFEKNIFIKRPFVADQKDKTQRKHPSRIFNHSPRIEYFLEPLGILSKRIPLTVNKLQLKEDVLNSVTYTESGNNKSREFFTYDDNAKRLTSLNQFWHALAGDWVNSRRSTSTYDDSGNWLTGLYDAWEGGVWVNTARSTYTYDGSGNRLTELQEYRDWDAGWNAEISKKYRYTYTYDGSGNLLTELREDWDNNAGLWGGGGRKTYTYDGNGNLLTELAEYEDSNAGIWVKVWRSIYTYDGNENWLTELREYWNLNAGMWVNNKRYTYTYDGSGNRLTRLVERWDSNAGIWGNSSRTTYTYNGSGNWLTILAEIWDSNTGIWAKYRYTYTYDGSGNWRTMLAEIWINNYYGIWANDYRYKRTYDDSGNLLTELREYWNLNAGIWVNNKRFTYTYDGRDNLIHFNSEAWSGSSWYASRGHFAFNNNYNDHYFCEELSADYSRVTSVDNSDNNVLCSFSLSQNFPNPFNPTTTISYSVSGKTNVKIAIYNSLGQEVSVLIDKEHTPAIYKIKFNASKLASGIYFYKIVSDKFVKTKKMLLIR